VSMYIHCIPNRNSPPAYLLREGYRQEGKVKTRTLANLTALGEEKIALIAEVLKGAPLARVDEAVEIRRALPHGQVAAVLGTLRKLGLDRLIEPKSSRQRDLVVAMIVERIVAPRSKLATARLLAAETAASSLGDLLGLGEVDSDELYEALDWLGARQERIEAALAKRHLAEGCLVLYDLTSSYLEGRHCELAAYGHSRDGRKGKLQIVFGLLCATDGCPVAVEVFEGNTADPKTLASQIEKLRGRFALTRVVLVGDRGMITEARIEEELKPAGLDWITALRAPAIKKLAAAGGPLQLSLFDQSDLAEITSPEYPKERLIVCYNPLLADERARKREALLAATEAELDKIAAATRREQRRLKGKDQIGLRVGRMIDKRKMAKHFDLEIGETSFSFQRNEAAIRAEAALDGIYVIRTSLPVETLSAEKAVAAYKSLSTVERAFGSLKTIDLKVRPIHHRRARRVRGHVLLCMLAYYLAWHMRRKLAPLLFDEDDPAAAAALRPSPVAPAQRSPTARRKAASKRTADGLPVHSFQTLLADLATLTRNQVATGTDKSITFTAYAAPTPVQQRAFDLLAVKHIL